MNTHGIIPTKKQTSGNKVPYGRKRSCWKKNYTSDTGTAAVVSPPKSVAEAGVITCAICGIQRYYKFVKQTKKFGLHSCEPCRKFISSMITYVKNDEHVLFNCTQKGPENCLITESIPFRNGPPKSKKDALSNMRCKACWLALCLEKYQMPIGLRNSLAQFIAEDDRPAFTASEADLSINNMDFRSLSKRKHPSTTGKTSCLKVLSNDFLRNSVVPEIVNDKKKIVIFRLTDIDGLSS